MPTGEWLFMDAYPWHTSLRRGGNLNPHQGR